MGVVATGVGEMVVGTTAAEMVAVAKLEALVAVGTTAAEMVAVAKLEVEGPHRGTGRAESTDQCWCHPR